ncbi:MAG: glycosyltransferase family 4 protein [Candidatus Paceibacterota bacterium]
MKQKRHKILYIITKGNFGGAQRYVFDLATSLPRETFDVSVAFGQAGMLAEKLRDADIKTIEIKSLQRDVNLLLDLKSFFELVKIFIKEKPDTIHINSSKIGGLGSLAGRVTGVPNIIFTAHGWAWNENRNAISKVAIKFLHWLTIVFSHKTIAVSENLAKQVTHWPFISKKIHVIHNGIAPFDLKDRAEARAALIKIYGGTITPEKWIGTAAELHKNKGLDFLINAFSKIESENPNSEIFIMGEGEERNNLEKLIAEKNLQDKIHLLGHVKDAKSYLKAFDVFTLTSRTEALPYSIPEAGLASLPVVASSVGGIPEIIENGKSGILIEKGNIEQIQKALSTLLNDEATRQTYGRNLKEKVERQFLQKEMVRKTIALYN